MCSSQPTRGKVVQKMETRAREREREEPRGSKTSSRISGGVSEVRGDRERQHEGDQCGEIRGGEGGGMEQGRESRVKI